MAQRVYLPKSYGRNYRKRDLKRETLDTEQQIVRCEKEIKRFEAEVKRARMLGWSETVPQRMIEVYQKKRETLIAEQNATEAAEQRAA